MLSTMLLASDAKLLVRSQARLRYHSSTMLIKFDSKVGTFSTFSDVAKVLLKAMGQSGQWPGAILAKDIPGALKRLKAATAGTKADPHAGSDAHAEPGDVVSLGKRAFPLIELLGHAARQNADVTWDVDKPKF